MAATATPARTWPRTITCTCGTHILHARHQGAGRPIPLDPIPVLPRGRCGACGGRGRVGFDAPISGDGRGNARAIESGDLAGHTTRVRDTCPVCDGTGQRGEPLTADHVLMDPDGIARPYDGTRHHWEAAHRRHTCT